MIGASGINAWYDRASSIWSRVDVGSRSNSFGLAIVEVVNDQWRKKGKKVKDLLPAWSPLPNPAQFGSHLRTDIKFSDNQFNWTTSSSRNPAPQQLTMQQGEFR
jgi:hypothetical protein